VPVWRVPIVIALHITNEVSNIDANAAVHFVVVPCVHRANPPSGRRIRGCDAAHVPGTYWRLRVQGISSRHRGGAVVVTAHVSG
jgi:hypothetical protein